MSYTPKITFSSVADLNTWSIDGDSKVLVFASPSEAKRAEELFTAIQRELSEARAECERLRYAVDLAARVMGGEGVEDQGEAWDKCKQILDQACAERAAIDAARKP